MGISNAFSYFSVASVGFALGRIFEKSLKNESMIHFPVKEEDVVPKAIVPLSTLSFLLLIGLIYRVVQEVWKLMSTDHTANCNEVFVNLKVKVQNEQPIALNSINIMEKLNEIKEILTIPHVSAIKSILILGEPGVGKSSLVYEFVRRIMQDLEFAPELKQKNFYQIDCASIVAGTRFRGDLEAQVGKIKSFMIKNKNTSFFFIDEFHQMNNDMSQNNLRLPDYFKDVLTEGVSIIGATTNKDYDDYLIADKAFIDRFFTITILEPSPKEMVGFVMGIKQKYERYGMTYQKKEIEYLVQQLIPFPGAFPRKAITRLDRLNAKILQNRQENNILTLLKREDIDALLKQDPKRNNKHSYYS